MSYAIGKFNRSTRERSTATSDIWASTMDSLIEYYVLLYWKAKHELEYIVAGN
jgi:hypothetical protein